MPTDQQEQGLIGMQSRLSNEQLRLLESTAGTGAFEFELATQRLVTTSQVAVLFGLDPKVPRSSFEDWEPAIFFDDVPKLRAEFEIALQTGAFSGELRVTHPDRSVHWLEAKAEIVADQGGVARWLRGTCYDITERKVLQARLLAANETLEARVAELREEARTLEILNRTGVALAAELDLDRLVQTVTDAGVDITGAQFGAFFYNVVDEKGEGYTLHSLSGVPREAFLDFPMPRNTAVFEPTFRGLGPVCSNDILADPRYGKSEPHFGMPQGHLSVRSYLAVPVVSRSSEVLGGLFFGHAEPGVFTVREERIITGIAAQAAVAIDNARLYQTSQREIAARKQTEEALQALNETLEQRVSERTQQLEASYAELTVSERRFRLLVEAVTDYAIFMVGPDGTVVKWNPGAERIKGYSANEIIGRHIACFYTEEDRRSGLPDRVIATAAATGKYEGEGWRVRKDGTQFWASVVLHAIHDERGDLVGFAKVTRDMTEKRAAEEQLRQSQKMEAIGQLTGGVAHDFNNLLTVISGNMEALQRRLSERNDSQLLRMANSALLASSRAATLTHQLLAFSRRQPLQPKSVSVNALITGMSELIRRILPESISIETVLAGGVWSTFVDANQLENCLLNLAVNARDAMPDGGRLTIEAANVWLDDDYAANEAVPAGQYVGIFVSDSGVGMGSDVVAKAFEPFFTTKDVGQGTGLGLSQVYGFVKQSGGHVKIYSEVGAGSTVKIYLPRLVTPDLVMQVQAAAVAVPKGSGEVILVVEDEPHVRAFAIESLKEAGYRVLHAQDGAQALRVLDAHRDVVLLLTDVGLPNGMNGRQLADEVRRRRADLKVLFTSGYARNAIVHHGRLDPGVEFITKPFTYAALATKVRRMLDAKFDNRA
jgi:PAS domain S-box-containing protein